MHFDDRLETVLRLPATSDALARIQYRQLLDILGSDRADSDNALIKTGYGRLAELSASLPVNDRAEVLRPGVSRLRSPQLLALLAAGEPIIASAAIGSAELSEDQWLALVPALPVRARGILRHRRDLPYRVELLLERLGISDRGLPPAEAPLELVDLAEPVSRPAFPVRSDDIATLLRRIESFSRARREAVPSVIRDGEAPRLPFEDLDRRDRPSGVAAFDFATDALGRINWTDDVVAPMVVGMHVAAGQDGALRAPAQVAARLRNRQPLVNVAVAIDGAPAVSGIWQIDAAPCFDRATGSFSGYAGRFRRPADHCAEASPPPPPADEAGRIRQILHELKTPASAIQMAAEIVQQNLFGPTPHEYRALAAMIASDIAYVLAGFDELDRLARLESSAISLDRGKSDLAAVTQSVVGHLLAYTGKRGSGFAFRRDVDPVPVPLSAEEAERVVWRLLAVLAGEAAPNEVLELDCTLKEGQAVLSAQVPATLAVREGDALFRTVPGGNPGSRAISAGMFGSGLSLRLARAEARAAGGSLQRDGNHLSLRLPALSDPVGAREPV